MDFGRFEVKTQKIAYTRNNGELSSMFSAGKRLDPYKSAGDIIWQKFLPGAEISASTNWEPTIENPKNDRFSDFRIF